MTTGGAYGLVMGSTYSGADVARTGAIGSLYWPTRTVTAPFRRLWFDVQWDGTTNVPGGGPVILAANHVSFLDSFLLMYGLPRKVLFLGKAEYCRNWRTRIFPAAGMIPVDRSGRGVSTSLATAAAVLDGGGVVGVFPEGTRSRDGLVHRGHSGAAHLAQRSGAALIPVGISGTDEVQPPGVRFPRRGGEIRFRFGPPIGVSRHGRGAAARRALTRELMEAVATLAGRSYVDETAPMAAPAPRAGEDVTMAS